MEGRDATQCANRWRPAAPPTWPWRPPALLHTLAPHAGSSAPVAGTIISRDSSRKQRSRSTHGRSASLRRRRTRPYSPRMYAPPHLPARPAVPRRAPPPPPPPHPKPTPSPALAPHPAARRDQAASHPEQLCCAQLRASAPVPPRPVRAQATLGNKWTEIAKLLEGRDAEQCRLRWRPAAPPAYPWRPPALLHTRAPHVGPGEEGTTKVQPTEPRYNQSTTKVETKGWKPKVEPCFLETLVSTLVVPRLRYQRRRFNQGSVGCTLVVLG